MSELPELHWSPSQGLIYRTDPDSLGDGRYVAWQPGGRYLNDGLPADAQPLTTAALPQCPHTRVSVLFPGEVRRCSYPEGHHSPICEYISEDGNARQSWPTGSPDGGVSNA